MMTVERILNHAAEKLESTGLLDQLLDSMGNQIEDYRLTFPTLFEKGRVVQIIALLAYRDDTRLATILRRNGIVLKTRSDLVFLCLAYHSEKEYLKQAKSIVRIYPEQEEYGDSMEILL